ncbi:MAG: hypothetical protein AAF206_13390 [Bacteroidota bacterium]
MSQYQDQLRDISELRSMMEQSTKFVSLSGLSGVSAGVVALVGAWVASTYLTGTGLFRGIKFLFDGGYYVPARDLLLEAVLLGMAILVVAVLSASFFSIRMARKKGLPVWNKVSRRLLINLAIPLLAGAIFCVQLAYYGFIGMIAPATLIFYGLALLNAGKYTLREIRYLGITEIGLGLLGSFFVGYGIIFWALGFGVFHILYGIVMYVKYER